MTEVQTADAATPAPVRRQRRKPAGAPKRGPVYSALFLVHEIVGLVSGLVVVVVCLTGAILVFEDAITAVLHSARTALVPAASAPLSIDSLVARVVAGQPDLEVAAVTRYDVATRPIMLTLAGGERLYVNPYTAAVVARQHGDEPFFAMMTALHRRLLAGQVGRRIVGFATVAFLLVLLSGIWIWWPKNRTQLRARLTLARRVGWKRRNYDLHVVLGIYSVVVLFVLAATGLVWSFRTVGNAVDGLTPRAERTKPPPRSTPTPGATRISLDSAFAVAKATMRPSRIYVVDVPTNPKPAIGVMALPYDAPWKQAWDQAYLDQYTGRVLRVDWFRNRPAGEYARRITHPLHVGDLYGLPSQIAAFLACLVATIAPVTGFIIWVNRKWPRTFRRSS